MSKFIVPGLFILSGFSALVYQIAWQRKLYTIFGISIEASAVIITTFMLGLGTGALLGGILSRQKKLNLLNTFGLIEAGIGIYAFISLTLLTIIENAGLNFNSFYTLLIIILFLLVPTILMGASLPVLIQYMRKKESLALSINLLYFANSLGAALAGFSTVFIIFELMGLSGTIEFAGSINIFVGLSALFINWKQND